MTDFLLAAAGFVLAMVAIGLVRVLRGPGDADRMMALEFSGSSKMRRFSLAVALLLCLMGGAPFADDSKDADKPKAAKPEETPKALPLNEKEQAFADLLKDAALVGNFTIVSPQHVDVFGRQV